jgi:hypothetical protein
VTAAAEYLADWQPAPPAFPRVEVPDVGPVSLATLDELREARAAARASADHLVWLAAELDGLAEDRLAQAGAILLTRRDAWAIPPGLAALVARGERLVRRVARLDGLAADVERGGALTRVAVLPALGAARTRAAARLRRVLVLIAGGPAGAEAPDVPPLWEHAAELRTRAEGLRRSRMAVLSRLAVLDGEIAVREEAERTLGVDAPRLAAHVLAHGLPAAACPLGLEPGEVAHLVLDAALARTATARLPAPGEPASRPAPALTGLRCWLGRLHDRPAPAALAGGPDPGVLVVSSRRLRFAGRGRSLAIPLAALGDPDVFADGIAVRAGDGPAAELLLVGAPRLVALYLSWAAAGG